MFGNALCSLIEFHLKKMARFRKETLFPFRRLVDVDLPFEACF